MSKHEFKPSDFDREVGMIDMDQVADKRSRWGNDYNYITREQIDELMNGKVLFIDDGEYCHFVAFRKENENEEN